MRPEKPRGFRGAFRTDADARAVYSEAAGIGRAMPLAVAVPVDAGDAATLVRWARDNAQPLVPRGSGSSMAGGAVGEHVVVDLSRLREIQDADPETRSIRAGVGVLRGELDRNAARAGLRFPVDPSSGEFCTIGGMVATNAAGPHSMRHGPTRPWILAVDCVFEDGSQATLRRGTPPPDDIPAIARFVRGAHRQLLEGKEPSHSNVLKDSSGYAVSTYAQTHELIDLLVGSEGTLALFTAVEVALVPPTGGTAGLLASFATLEHAVEGAMVAREGGAAACELLDRTFLAIASRGDHPLPVPLDTDAVLLIEVEGPDSMAAADEAEKLRRALRAGGAMECIVASDARHESELWSFRHAASPAIARMDPGLRSMQFIEDGAVPPGALAAYVRGVRAALERAETPGVIFGHAGDAHVHVNPLVDVSRPDWRQRLESILLDVTDLVARLDGTLTGEHGDGRLRTPLLDRVWRAEERENFAAIKNAFDPANILNPGVKVPMSGQRAIDAVKYDPDADSLPERARKALALVERERGYGRFRLDLL